MQDYITKDALLALNINLNDDDIASLVEQLNQTVEERVGEEIAESLTDDDLEELVKLQQDASDEELGKWIAEHVPDYQEIVADAIAITLGELAENADSVK